jgi:hypothetical protein
MSMRKFALIAAIASALVVSACGNADKNEYVTDVNQATTALTTSMAKIGQINPTDPAAVAGTLDEGGAAIEKAAKDFEAITPPEDAQKAHDLMVSGLHSLATTFGDAADAARAKDTEKLMKVLGEIQTSKGAKDIQAAQNELMKQGYKFES